MPLIREPEDGWRQIHLTRRHLRLIVTALFVLGWLGVALLAILR